MLVVSLWSLAFQGHIFLLISTTLPVIVDFQKSILPTKIKADLYSATSLHKHGKNLFYGTFLKYSKVTDEKLIIAPGIKVW